MSKEQKDSNNDYLNHERDVLKWLEDSYQSAADECAQKIAELNLRAGFEPENIQTIIYQRQYQEAIQSQIEATLTNLRANTYQNIDEYLHQCYNNGFIGTMYDLQAQGIPLIRPIDQRQVVQAIYNDSRISQGLYTRLGEDFDKLKNDIAFQVSRGIINGESWTQTAEHIANGMNSPFLIARNNSMRIARTEGHRVQVQSTMDAARDAREAGADIVKQWDATLDERTRESHRILDGEIRELDEPFSNGLMFPSDPHGDASEVINCRCALNRRAKWALDEGELQTLRDRANFFGLDKSENFADYQRRYLGATESEE